MAGGRRSVCEFFQVVPDEEAALEVRGRHEP